MKSVQFEKDIVNEWLAADSWDSFVPPKPKCKPGAPFTVQIVNACTSAIANVDIGDSYTGRTQSETLNSTWAATNTGLANLVIRSFGVNGSNIFVGDGSGRVYLSTNNGSSWAAAYSGISLTTVYAIVFGTGTNMFAGGTGSGGGVYLSTNNGSSWTAVNTGLTNTSVFALLTDGSNIFAGTAGGVFLSTNNGTSWTAVNTGLTNLDIQKLVISGTNLFAATLGGVFLSTNNGTSWTAVNTGLTNLDVNSLAISGNNLFAGTLGGVFLSTNNGTSWTEVNSGLTDLDVYVVHTVGTRIFAGTFGGGIFLSTNNGTSWTAFNTGLSTLIVWSMANSGNNIFAGTGGGGVFYNTLSNFGQNSNITITSPVNGISYQEFLAERENAPIRVIKTEVISTSAGQLDRAVTITHRDSNGLRNDHTINPAVDPNQSLTDRLIDKKKYLFDGFTRIRLNQINGSATVTLRFFPEQCGDKPKRSPDFLPGEKLRLPELQNPVYPVYISKEEWEHTKDGDPIITYTEPKIIKVAQKQIEERMQTFCHCVETFKKKDKTQLTVCLQ